MIYNTTKVEKNGLVTSVFYCPRLGNTLVLSPDSQNVTHPSSTMTIYSLYIFDRYEMFLTTC